MGDKYFVTHHLYLILLACMILSLCVGSFLTSLVYRLPLRVAASNVIFAREILNKFKSKVITLSRWSICAYCQERLPLNAKIPILSYLIFRGKSQCCKQRIPLQYPFIELSTCLLTLVLLAHFGVSIKFIFGVIFLWSLIALCFIDINTLTLPDEITLSLLWVGLTVNSFNIFCELRSAVFGAIFGYLSLYLMSLIVTKIRKIESMGRGDMKLLSSLGAWLGLSAVPKIIFFASFYGTLICGIYLICAKKSINSRLPFGPFLALGGFLTLFNSDNVISSVISPLIINFKWR